MLKEDLKLPGLANLSTYKLFFIAFGQVSAYLCTALTWHSDFLLMKYNIVFFRTGVDFRHQNL